MVQGYYTLSEAAQYLNLPVDELKQMAQKGRIRSFQDRGTLRFRIQDVQEIARQRGISSDPDLVLGEASLPPKKGDSARSPRSPQPSGPKTPPRDAVPDVFDFDLSQDPHLDLGEGVAPPSSGGKKGPSGSKAKSDAGPKSGAQPRSGDVPQAKAGPTSGTSPRSGIQPRSGGQPRSGVPLGAAPAPRPGSDSDVKIVGHSDEVTISLAPDSDIKLRDKDSGSRGPHVAGGSSAKVLPPGSSASTKRSSQLGPRSAQPPDSGVRLIPMESDSDVKIVGSGHDEVPLGEAPPAAQGDSNVRLEKVRLPDKPEDSSSMLTEEINLDEELRKEEERLRQQAHRPSKVKPKSELKFPTTSPFELSESDVDAPTEHQELVPAPPPADSSDFELPAAPKDDSSDFDLAASPGDSSNFELTAARESSMEIPLLQDSGSMDAAPAADPGGSSEDDFSLELADDDVDLGGGGGELTAPASGINLGKPVDSGISLEQPASSDDSLEFDLSLEPEATPRPAQMKEVDDSPEGSSEFELSLELPEGGEAGTAGEAPADSDSEFELTLDDDSTDAAPQVKDAGESQDIFESDFDIPALEQEGDAAESATVDTELESSDFDLALDDSELAADEESGSQVVALDEEEVEPVAEEEVEPLAEEDAGFGDLEGEEVEVEEEEEDTRPPRVEVVEKLIRPAPWGVMPALVMLPCVILMLLVGFVGFEVVQSSVGHRPPGMMTRLLNDNVLSGITGVKLQR